MNTNIQSASLSKLNWIYRGEGNANLVLSLPKEKIILRMQKGDIDDPKCLQSVAQTEGKLVRDVKFYTRVMEPLLGKVFVPSPFLIRISDNDVAELNSVLGTIRPKFRQDKKLFCTLITGQPDYTNVLPSLTCNFFENGLRPTHDLDEKNPTYSIELKPKQGWLPECDRVHPTCTFCTMQYYKLMKKSTKSISKYCPLDLFSGNPCRMRKALKNLLLTPQNNLKIFKDGNLIFHEDSDNDIMDVIKDALEPNGHNSDAERLVDKWAALLHDALTTNMSDEPSFELKPDDASQAKKESFSSSILKGLLSSCDWSKERLPDNCVLQRILSIQKLQTLGFEETYKLYSDRRNRETDYDYVERINVQKLDAIDRYLLSTTAKDCSLFISFQRCSRRNVDKSGHFLTDIDGVEYRFNIGVADLDPKPLATLDKHAKRDSDALLATLCIINSDTS